MIPPPLCHEPACGGRLPTNGRQACAVLRTAQVYKEVGG